MEWGSKLNSSLIYDSFALKAKFPQKIEVLYLSNLSVGMVKVIGRYSEGYISLILYIIDHYLKQSKGSKGMTDVVI